MHRISLLIEHLSDPEEGLISMELVIVREIEGCSNQAMFCVSMLLAIEDCEESCYAVFMSVALHYTVSQWKLKVLGESHECWNVNG
jgi:hypothetical protein